MIPGLLKKTVRPVLSRRGLTMPEVLLALAIGVFVLGLTISIFTRQNSLLKNENDQTLVRAKARHAIKLIAREIRMAGYGLAPGQAISGYAETAGSALIPTGPLDALPDAAAALGFRINRENVRTFLDYSSTSMVSGSILPVIDGSAFRSGDRIAIYNPGDDATWDEALPTVDTASAGSLTLQSALIHNYPRDPATRAIQVAKFSDYEIRLDAAGRIIKTVDGQASVLIDGAALGAIEGLRFDFHGAASPRLVELIGIHLHVVDPENPGASIEIKTDIRLRNAAS